MKICSKCQHSKEFSDFYKYKNSYQSYCKKCAKDYNNADRALENKKLWRLKNPNYDKLRRKEKRKQIKKQKQEYYINNKEKISKKSKQYREKNREYLKNKHREYNQKNKIKANEYYKKRKIENISVRIKHSLRNRIRLAIKNKSKVGSTVTDLGCSIEQLKNWIENKFLPGMTWNNWSRTGWHIDHIKPLASFDLTDREQFLQAINYTNLQPLWAKDNLAKSDKIL